MKKYDVIILGAGASGLMCAAHLDKRLTVAIIEGNERVAKKIKISGGGKCNITNVHVDASRYDGDSELVQKTLERFSKDDLLIYLQ
ncbi:MAG: NAD(P)/FAD-dependent oxidoreductase, partial [Epsilonproteobacteria bacterium]|nr:NAD(P)/FAD-dependent oxidoreductase [Campylobacterota bacterium]